MKINIQAMKESAKHTFTIGKILVKKHAPLGFVILGSVGVVATAVTTYQAAKKIDKKVDKFNERIEEGEDITKREMVMEISKDLVAPVLTGALTIASFTAAYCIQNNRIKALTSVLALATEEHRRYRSRARDILDEETFKKIDTPTRTVTKNIDGKDKEVTEAAESDFYGRWIATSSKYVSDSPEYMEQLIKITSEKADNIINTKGILLFNELMDLFGFDNVAASLPYGWTDIDGFFVSYDEVMIFDDKLGVERPEFYVRWQIPRNLYDTTQLNDLFKRRSV